MKNELIRDRLVAGIQDSDLSEHLQLNAALTLSDAIKAIRQHEAVHESQKELRLGDSTETPIVVDTVQRRAQQSSCQRCGRDHQRRELCPAKDAICRRCGRKLHFTARCFSKTRLPPAKVDSTQPNSDDQLVDALYLDATVETTVVDAIDDPKTPQKYWSAQVDGGLKCPKEITFKLDTGAEVTAISDTVHEALGNAILERPSKVLCGPSRKPLPVLGRFSTTLSYRGRSSLQELLCTVSEMAVTSAPVSSLKVISFGHLRPPST